jgi:hypothetical protein
MDAGLAWTIAGSVAGVIAIPSAVVIGVMQLRQARKDSGAIPPSVFQPGLLAASQPSAPPEHAARLVVVGEIPQEPPGWQPRPDPMAALEVPGLGSRIVVRAVTGMRGVGKTQLAAAFARTRLAEGDGRLLAWIAAETSGGLLAGLADTAEALALPAAGVDAQTAGLAVRHWLEADGTGCLMVLDNVTDPELIQPFLPVAGAARVIITSNQKSVEALGTPVGVEVFTEAEGLSYLAHRTGLTEVAGAREVGKELGWLPLALAQAAAVIAAQRLDYSVYLDRLRRIPVAQLLAPVPAGQYPVGVAAAMLVSLESATAGDTSRLCTRVMDLLAVLSPDGIPRALVHAVLAAGLPGADAAGGEAADAALARLAGVSLLGFTVDGASVVVHRLVQRVIRDLLDANGRLSVVCRAAADLLNARAAQLAPACYESRAAARNLIGQLENRAAARDLIGQIIALAQAAAPCCDDSEVTLAMIRAEAWAQWFLWAASEIVEALNPWMWIAPLRREARDR